MYCIVCIHTCIYLNQATWPIDMTERMKEMRKNYNKNEKEYTFTHMYCDVHEWVAVA